MELLNNLVSRELICVSKYLLYAFIHSIFSTQIPREVYLLPE